MVVNVSLALPQFSSTLMRRLILENNNLELMLVRVPLCERQGGVEWLQLYCVVCCTSIPLDVYEDMWPFSLISSNSLKFTCCTCRA